MPALKTIGLFESDSRIYYVGLGITILKDPLDGKIKAFYLPWAKDKLGRALKMSGMRVIGDEPKRGEYLVKEVEEEV